MERESVKVTGLPTKCKWQGRICVAVPNILEGVQVMSSLESQVNIWKTP